VLTALTAATRTEGTERILCSRTD